MRDVEMSPDGSFFVVATTGGPHSGPLFDSPRGGGPRRRDRAQPTWTNDSGGDTLWGVEVTQSAVYIGGHQRWMNSSNGGDSAAQGSVPRPGLLALDPQSGIPLKWTPAATRAARSPTRSTRPTRGSASSATATRSAFAATSAGASPSSPTARARTPPRRASVAPGQRVRRVARLQRRRAVPRQRGWFGDRRHRWWTRLGGRHERYAGAVAQQGSTAATSAPATCQPRSTFPRPLRSRSSTPSATTRPVATRCRGPSRSRRGTGPGAALHGQPRHDHHHPKIFNISIDGLAKPPTTTWAPTPAQQPRHHRAFNITSDGTVNVDFTHGSSGTLCPGRRLVRVGGLTMPLRQRDRVRRHEHQLSALTTTFGFDWTTVRNP